MDTTIKVESGIPMPEGLGGRPAKYPWKRMGVGDSFAVPAPLPAMGKMMWAVAKKTGRKFARRSLVENGVEVIRVWRVE